MPVGKALSERQVERRTDAWHDGAGGTLKVHEYLGWTRAEYAQWAETGQLPGADKEPD